MIPLSCVTFTGSISANGRFDTTWQVQQVSASDRCLSGGPVPAVGAVRLSRAPPFAHPSVTLCPGRPRSHFTFQMTAIWKKKRLAEWCNVMKRARTERERGHVSATLYCVSKTCDRSSPQNTVCVIAAKQDGPEFESRSEMICVSPETSRQALRLRSRHF